MERRGRRSSMTQCTACPLCLTSCAVPEVSVSSGQSSGIFSADRLVLESSRSTHSVCVGFPQLSNALLCLYVSSPSHLFSCVAFIMSQVEFL